MLNLKIANRKQQIEKTLSALAGVVVELTVRGDQEFTVSADGNRRSELSKLTPIFGTNVETSFRYDAEIDFSVLFIDVK